MGTGAGEGARWVVQCKCEPGVAELGHFLGGARNFLLSWRFFWLVY